MRYIKRVNFDLGSISVFDRSPNPDTVITLLDKKLKKVHLLFNVPQTLAEAREIHEAASELLLSRYMKTFADVSARFEKLEGIRIAPKKSASAEEWLTDY